MWTSTLLVEAELEDRGPGHALGVPGVEVAAVHDLVATFDLVGQAANHVRGHNGVLAEAQEQGVLEGLHGAPPGDEDLVVQVEAAAAAGVTGRALDGLGQTTAHLRIAQHPLVSALSPSLELGLGRALVELADGPGQQAGQERPLAEEVADPLELELALELVVLEDVVGAGGGDLDQTDVRVALVKPEGQVVSRQGATGVTDHGQGGKPQLADLVGVAASHEPEVDGGVLDLGVAVPGPGEGQDADLVAQVSLGHGDELADLPAREHAEAAEQGTVQEHDAVCGLVVIPVDLVLEVLVALRGGTGHSHQVPPF